MAPNIARGFHNSVRTLVRFVGSPLEEVISSNGLDGDRWHFLTKSICNEIEKADSRINVAHIQGTQAHLSSKDKNDSKPVITVGLKTHSGTRVGALHIHLDGTFKFFASRVGKEGGYDKNIARAGIQGFIPDDSNIEIPE